MYKAAAEVSSCTKPTTAAVHATARPKIHVNPPPKAARPQSIVAPPRRPLPRPQVTQQDAEHTAWQHTATTIQPSCINMNDTQDERLLI